MVFSGSAVVDHRNTSGFGLNGRPPLIAIYTGHSPGLQTQDIAYSNDDGRTWIKYPAILSLISAKPTSVTPKSFGISQHPDG